MRLIASAVAFAVGFLVVCCSSWALAQDAAPEENPVALAQVEGHVGGFALSPDGRDIAVWGADWGDPNKPDRKRVGNVQVWNVAERTLKVIGVGHTDVVQRVVWSRDGRQLASQSQDGMVALWDALSGRLKKTLAPVGPPLRFGDDASPEEAERSMMTALSRPNLLGFSPDGTQVLAVAAKVSAPTAPPQGSARKAAWSGWRRTLQPLLRVWHTRNGREVRSTPFGKRGVEPQQETLLPEGKRFRCVVRSGSGKNPNATIETRDVASGALLSSWTVRAPFNDVGNLSNDGSRLLCSRRDDARLAVSQAQVRDAASGRLLQVLEDRQASMGSGRFSHDNAKLIVGVRGGSLAVFDISSGKKEKTFYTGSPDHIWPVALTPEGKYLLFMQHGGREVRRMDLAAPPSNPTVPRPITQSLNPRAIRFAPDGSLWLGWGQDDWGRELRTGVALQLRHVSPAGKMLQEISIPEKALVDQVTFSPDFSLAAGILGTQPAPAFQESAGVGVWDIRNKKMLWRLPRSKYMMSVLAFSPDSKTLVTDSGQGDNTLQEWDMANGQPKRRFFKSQSRIESLVFSAEGKYLAVGTEGGTLALLAMPGAQQVAALDLDPSVSGLSFSSDGARLASGGTLRAANNSLGVSASVWDVESRQVVAEFSIEGRLFGGVALSPDGKTLALAHFKTYERRDDGRIEVWEVSTRRLLASLRDRSGAEHPAFALDGKSLFSVNGGWVKAWDLEPQQGAPAP